MPPPPHRRTGFSRRAQYSLLIGYAVAVTGIIASLLLLAVAVVDPRGFAAIRGAAVDVTAPVSSGGRSVSAFFSDIGAAVSNYFRAGSQNARLRAELEQTRRDLIAAQTAKAENEQLRALLGLARQTEDEVTVARIVGSSYGSARRLATLSAGTGDGVLVGQPVRSADGLIGRVLEAGRWASRVLLVSDGGSSVPVRSLRNNVPALAVGRGDGTVELRTLEVGVNPFRRGDVLVTSGIGGIFPPGVPVATVIRLEGDTAIARPIADPARIEAAIVQPIYQPAASGELADARPTRPGGPIATPPPTARDTTPPPLQRNPDYQPALQDPQPGQIVGPAAAQPQAPQTPQAGTQR